MHVYASEVNNIYVHTKDIMRFFKIKKLQIYKKNIV